MAKSSFRERMEHYVQELVNPMSYYDWINQNTTIGGVPFTCDRYPFQKDIIKDMSLELISMLMLMQSSRMERPP